MDSKPKKISFKVYYTKHNKIPLKFYYQEEDPIDATVVTEGEATGSRGPASHRASRSGLNLFFPRFYHFFPSTLPFFPSTLLSPTLRTFNVFFHPELLAIRNASEGPDFARSRRSMLERLAPSPFLEAALPRTPCAFAGRHRGRGRPPTQTNTKTQTRTTQYNRSAGAKNRCTAGLQEYRN